MISKIALFVKEYGRSFIDLVIPLDYKETKPTSAMPVVVPFKNNKPK